jgi:hypothetical protein
MIQGAAQAQLAPPPTFMEQLVRGLQPRLFQPRPGQVLAVPMFAAPMTLRWT